MLAHVLGSLCEELNETLPAIAGGTCCLGPDGPHGC
ncbi:Hypothetical protein PMT_2336 [Prochlorococcus marinus str. MIT 9313]|uniref:Uncharacterized protein n=1 Tax=Prochlorococcus marinus (strain MIT 9313) TaxID=74547 RepID=B9ERI0_PROMM|nr:Hypothetical protein PMT_2336 [Prochlorococcus marinus str. MIT 9313]